MEANRFRVEHRIIAIVKKIAGHTNELTARSHLFDEAGLTSIGSIELVVELEHIYGIDLMEPLTNGEIQRIGDVVEAVCQHHFGMKDR